MKVRRLQVYVAVASTPAPNHAACTGPLRVFAVLHANL